MTQYRLTVEGTYASGRKWSFRQHYASGATLAAIEATWVGAWVAAWTTIANPLQAIYPTTVVFTETTAASLTGAPYRETSKVIDTFSHPGTSVADGLPEQVAILVSRRTDFIGGRNRGRSSLPAPAEDTALAGELTALVAGHITTAVNGVRTAMTTAGHTPVIYNVKASLIDPVPQTNKTITSEKTDRVLRTQDRRIRKGTAVYV